MKNILVLYPNQLFPLEKLPQDVDRVVLVEDPLYFGRDAQYPKFMHKQKLVFMRASMRSYIEEVLWPAGYEVDYVDFHHLNQSGDIVNKISGFEEVVFFDLNDDILHRRLVSAINELNPVPEITIKDSPSFFLSRREVEDFFNKKSKSEFKDFYLWQRERFNILINPDTYKPVGGKLSHESTNNKRLPANHALPTFQVFGSNKQVDEAKKYVNHHFQDNPGSMDEFPWPVNRDEARKWLKEFIETRLAKYGPYEDALDGEAPYVYHSALSPLLNAGLLTPHEVVDQVLLYHEKNPIELSSLEAFIRQILGWREYMRGVYLKRHSKLRTSNVFGHNRKMTIDWYRGTTGLEPVDDVIKKVLKRGYAHHSERLMILGNIMFLCDFHPDVVYRWFMEMFVDSYDWVVVPNVYGMSQYSDGDGVVNKPYVSSSNYVLKMSHYKKDLWCDIWDGLYWRFVEKNRERLKKNPKMKLAVSQLDKMDDSQRRIIGYRSEDFLSVKTTL